MINLCHTFYRHLERRLRNVLLTKEVSLYLTIPLSTSTQSGIHTKRPPSEEWGTLWGLGSCRPGNAQDTPAPQHAPKILCSPQDYFLPTSPELTGTWGGLGFYFILFLISLQLNGKRIDFHCKYYHWSHLYPAIRNQQWSDKDFKTSFLCLRT